jgi:hypothetical protein
MTMELRLIALELATHMLVSLTREASGEGGVGGGMTSGNPWRGNHIDDLIN